MLQTYTAVVKHDDESWIGWIEEVPGVNCQEASREELIESLRITLTEASEFNRAEAGRVPPEKGMKSCRLRYEAARFSSTPASPWLREGGRHSWWHHPVSGNRSAVPRHAEINNHLARKTCRDLGIVEPEKF